MANSVTTLRRLKHKNARTQLASQTHNYPTALTRSFTPQYSTTLGTGYFTFNPAAEWGNILWRLIGHPRENSPRSQPQIQSKQQLSVFFSQWFDLFNLILRSIFAR